MDAFQNASSIQVQKVANMEDIRISDSDLKSKWRSLEKGLSDQVPQELNRRYSPTPPTINGRPSEEEEEVKTKRRLTWGSKPVGGGSSSNGSHRRVRSGSGRELQRDMLK